jgi:hypothetical protein
MTKQTEIAELKKEFLTLTRFDNGVEIQLSGAEYDEQIESIWQSRKTEFEAKAEAEAKATAKAAAESKLTALGLTTQDLRALGL